MIGELADTLYHEPRYAEAAVARFPELAGHRLVKAAMALRD